MTKFIIHYGGTSYVDTHDKNRYRLPDLFKFNLEKIKSYSGIPKELYNDIIAMQDNSLIELGNAIPLIQITLINIQNIYLNKEDSESNINNINNFFINEIWNYKNSYIDKNLLTKPNEYSVWLVTNFKNVLQNKAREQYYYYKDSSDFFGAILNEPYIFIERILNMILTSMMIRFKGKWIFDRTKYGYQDPIVSSRYRGIDLYEFNLEKIIPLSKRNNKYIYLKKLVF